VVLSFHASVIGSRGYLAGFSGYFEPISNAGEYFQIPLFSFLELSLSTTIFGLTSAAALPLCPIFAEVALFGVFLAGKDLVQPRTPIIFVDYL